MGKRMSAAVMAFTAAAAVQAAEPTFSSLTQATVGGRPVLVYTEKNITAGECLLQGALVAVRRDMFAHGAIIAGDCTEENGGTPFNRISFNCIGSRNEAASDRLRTLGMTLFAEGKAITPGAQAAADVAAICQSTAPMVLPKVMTPKTLGLNG